MKIKYNRQGKCLTVHVSFIRDTPIIVYLRHRVGDKMVGELMTMVSPDLSEAHFLLDLSTISATHFLEIITPARTYHRYIPSKYLNLSAEHE